MRRTRLLLLCLPLLALCATAQTPRLPISQITLGQSMVALNGPWKFHTGDDPQWANPNFDDSAWETIDLTPKDDSVDPDLGNSGYVPGWTSQGHPGYWGYAWYRMRIRLVASPGQRLAPKLAIAGSAAVDDAYQFYADGKLLGSFGSFSRTGKRPITYNGEPEFFLLPVGNNPNTTETAKIDMVLAFRVWMEPSTLTLAPDVGGFHRPPLLGEASVVSAHYQLEWLDIARSYASAALLAALFLLLAILACCLILFDRSDPVYLWLAGVFLLMALNAANLCFAALVPYESLLSLNLAEDVVLRALVLGGWVMVWWVWFRLRKPAWVPRAVAGLTLLYLLANAIAEDIFFTVVPHPVSVVFHFVSLTVRVLLLLALLLIARWGIRQHGREGWTALPAMVLIGIAQFQNELQFLNIPTIWFPFGLQFSIADIARLVLAAAILILLVRRLLLSMRRQRELALDIKQAQEVQQVLFPEEPPNIPGLLIESEYHPARQVGGDFFQILANPDDGSVLIVVGDVTGKGLQAGMSVALLVGAIRNQAEISHDPLLMLQALNRRLHGRGSTYATAQALLIAPDGQATLANAGHLPPYLNGKELATEGALPLGIISPSHFPISHFQLTVHDHLVLISDGVPEAQNAKDQLFGFERIEALLQRSATAAQLAAAALEFGADRIHESGQADDILILRIARQPATGA